MNAVRLHVEHLSAYLRGDNPNRPVQVGVDTDRVVMILDTPSAEVLAKMIARVTSDLRDVDDVDQVMWDHTVVDLLCAKALATGPDALSPVNLQVVR